MLTYYFLYLSIMLTYLAIKAALPFIGPGIRKARQIASFALVKSLGLTSQNP